MMVSHLSNTTLQVYEDTTGLTVGDPVKRTGRPVSVELAPGLLGAIFDGIQRPLKDIQEVSKSIFIPEGIGLPAISRTTLWEFHPAKLAKGTCLTGGDIIGHVYENKLMKHHIILAPKARGKVQNINIHAFPDVLKSYNTVRTLFYYTSSSRSSRRRAATPSTR